MGFKFCKRCGCKISDAKNSQKYCRICAVKMGYVKMYSYHLENKIIFNSISEEEKKKLREEAFKVAEERINKEVQERDKSDLQN